MKIWKILALILLPSIALPQAIEQETRYEYNRKLFGNWRDDDRNCVNTRNEVLIRDAIEYELDARGCKVLNGIWRDFYTGKILTDVSVIDIDHVVPLREMWDSGLSEYPRRVLQIVYNDMDNLVVTHRSANRNKSSFEPHEWRKFNTIEQPCRFIDKWKSFKIKYNLSFDRIEYNFIINTGC